MLATQITPSAPLDATARRRAGATIRRAVLRAGAVGIVAAAAMVITVPAFATVAGSGSGNLTFSPASGATNQTPTWSTNSGCPAGYQGSAQVSIFKPDGTFLSSISNVAYNVTNSFSGKLDGSMSAILKFADVSSGGAIDFVVGCYSQVGATGSFTWVDSTRVTVSSGGTSYTTAALSASQTSTSGLPAGTAGSGSINAQRVAATNTADTSGLGSGALAGLIAGPCVLLAAVAGFIVYRRRQDRSRLM
jgi:hypothetical protein